VLQSTPEYAIFKQKIQKFSGEGAQPTSQTPLPAGRGHLLPHPPPLGAYGASMLASSAFDLHAFGAQIPAPSVLAIYLVGSIFFGLF